MMRLQRRLAALSLLCTSVACGHAPATPAPAAAVLVPSQDEADREKWAKSQGLLLKNFDLNRDGKPDVFKFYREEADPKNAGNKLEVLVRKELDINHDGKVDIIRLYDREGRVTEERDDLDFDGRIDEVIFYANGLLERKEIDLNYDGKPDIIKYFSDSKLVRVEADRNGDGRIDTWEYYENGVLDRVGTDTDLDGEADSWERRRQPAEGEAGQAGEAQPSGTSTPPPAGTPETAPDDE
jgi:hypothetical protein